MKKFAYFGLFLVLSLFVSFGLNSCGSNSAKVTVKGAAS
jgi:hypothetical protein